MRNYLSIFCLVMLSFNAISSSTTPLVCDKVGKTELKLICETSYYYHSFKPLNRDSDVTALVEALKAGENITFDCASKYMKNSIPFSLCRGNQLIHDPTTRDQETNDFIRHESARTLTVFDSLAFFTFSDDELGLKHSKLSKILHTEIHPQADLELQSAFLTGAMAAGDFTQNTLPVIYDNEQSFSAVARKLGYQYLIHGSVFSNIYNMLMQGYADVTKSGIHPHLFFTQMIETLPKNLDDIYGGTAIVLDLDYLNGDYLFHASRGWNQKGGLSIGQSVTSKQDIQTFSHFLSYLRLDKEQLRNEFVFWSNIPLVPLKMITSVGYLNQAVYWNDPSGFKVKDALLEIKNKFPNIEIIYVE